MSSQEVAQQIKKFRGLLPEYVKQVRVRGGQDSIPRQPG